MTKAHDPNCCLCGLPYERIGNNPAPLAQKGRCCDACNEVVIGARIDMREFAAEYARVEQAVLRVPKRAVMAAICASRGPGLWAAHKRELVKLRELYEALVAPDDGSEPPTQAQ